MAVGPDTSYAHLLIDQGWENYTAEEHETWQLLYERQMEVLAPQVCSEYLEALDTLGFTARKIPNFNEVNERLKAITGWQIVATEGLVKSKAFFDMLTDRKFPSGNLSAVAISSIISKSPIFFTISSDTFPCSRITPTPTTCMSTAKEEPGHWNTKPQKIWPA